MDDRETVAASAAGDQAGLAVAYDKYAAPLYGYCHWMLREPAIAADALQNTFISAFANLGGLHDAGQLRSWLWRIARDECERRPRAAGAGADDLAETAAQPADASPADARQAAQQAEIRRLIGAAVAEMKPEEREAIELSVRHGLDDTELAAVLGLSWSRAHSLSSDARAQLERILGALLIARTRRKDCPALDALLTGWDGRLTVPTGGLVSRHVDKCQTCAARKHGRLRPEVLAGLLPLPPATLPLELREQVLSRARATAEPARDRHRVVPALGSPRPTGFPRAAPDQVAPPTVPPPGTYGRILIFTLLDDRVADFDRLAEQTAEEVRTREPDTLVYAIHLVPNVPLARIFYENYRDQAAFHSHESQPYMQRFVADRRSCVLATNVIELTLKSAKVAPLANPQPAHGGPAVPAGTAPPPGARTQLPPGPPPNGPGTPRPEPVAPGPPPGAPAQAPQRLQPLPPARTQQPDQAQRPVQLGPLPSAGRRNGGA